LKKSCGLGPPVFKEESLGKDLGEMNKLRTRPDLIIALFIIMLAVFLTFVLLTSFMPGLPFVKGY
jgi:uncharacterized membrane protein (DUF485 family)